MKNRAVNVCLVKFDINITLERLFPHICLSEAFHSAWLMGLEFASKLNAMVEGTMGSGLQDISYLKVLKNLNRLKMKTSRIRSDLLKQIICKLNCILHRNRFGAI